MKYNLMKHLHFRDKGRKKSRGSENNLYGSIGTQRHDTHRSQDKREFQKGIGLLIQIVGKYWRYILL